MAATAASPSKEDENLGTYSLIWLDDLLNNSKENLLAREQLRRCIKHLLIFSDQQLCLRHIHSLSKDDRIVLIVNETFGREIVPQIFELRQIVSIYVHCTDKQTNERWANHFSKVNRLNYPIEEILDTYCLGQGCI
jgi:hypothetical protein